MIDSGISIRDMVLLKQNNVFKHYDISSICSVFNDIIIKGFDGNKIMSSIIQEVKRYEEAKRRETASAKTPSSPTSIVERPNPTQQNNGLTK